MTKRCPQCNRDKPLADFERRSGGPGRQCVVCRKRYANWSGKTLEEKLAGMPPRADAAPTGRVLWVPCSKNQKLGGIPASWSERGTCPPSCGLYEAGCYANYGKLGFHWRNVPRDGLPWDKFLEKVRGLPAGQVWRHNVAGDLQGEGGGIDVVRLRELVDANRGRRGFTFTHHSYISGPSIDVVLRNDASIIFANRNGFAVNVSTDTLEDADRVAAFQGLGDLVPVVTLLPHDAPIRLKTPAGRRVTVCPAETEGLTCRECELCAIPDRKTIIGFRAHGNYRKHVTELVQLRRKTAS
jgi:hypothetical protein